MQAGRVHIPKRLKGSDCHGACFVKTNPEGSVQIMGFTCPTTRRCLAVTNNGDVLTSTAPTGGPSSWSFRNLVPFEAASAIDTFVGNALFGASCPSASLCALVGAQSRIFTSTDPFATPGGAGQRRRGRRGRLRPRTIVVFAEGFWKLEFTRRRHIRARFRFYSRDGVRAFLCRPDRRRWRHCRSPYRCWVSRGSHALLVRAIGRTGLRGPVKTVRFRVRGPHRAQQRRSELSG